MNNLNKPKKPALILYAEDDEDDFLLVKDAFQESGLDTELRHVKDGEELMDYLLHQGSYQNLEESPRPMVILLDLNMPKKDGREALKEIKSNPQLRRIPVVVLTTSRAEEDVLQTYDLGVNSFIRKPIHFDRFVEIVKTLNKYWLDIVILPNS